MFGQISFTSDRLPVRWKYAAGQHHEKWSGIHASVISREGNFFGHGHFAAAHLVKNLAGFGVLLGYFLGGLRLSEIFQNALRDPRRGPKAFERGNDSVAPKNGAEPGHSRIRIRALGIVFDQHPKIGRGASAAKR